MEGRKEGRLTVKLGSVCRKLLFSCERETNQLFFKKRFPFHLVKYSKVMSGHDNEGLIDYEDNVHNVATSTVNGTTTSANDVDGKDQKKKKRWRRQCQ